ncbi:hypothetical protein ACP70R_043872 [Stipagrostis hirtigluma subsp. patula]
MEADGGSTLPSLAVAFSRPFSPLPRAAPAVAGLPSAAALCRDGSAARRLARGRGPSAARSGWSRRARGRDGAGGRAGRRRRGRRGWIRRRRRRGWIQAHLRQAVPSPWPLQQASAASLLPSLAVAFLVPALLASAPRGKFGAGANRRMGASLRARGDGG